MHTIVIKPRGGDTVPLFFKGALDLAKKEGCAVEFDFNDIPVTVMPDSDLDSIIKEYLTRIWIR